MPEISMMLPDPTWLDQQYNALVAVPDARAIFKSCSLLDFDR